MLFNAPHKGTFSGRLADLRYVWRGSLIGLLDLLPLVRTDQ